MDSDSYSGANPGHEKAKADASMTVAQHEDRSQERYEMLADKLSEIKALATDEMEEHKMAEGILDKVNVNVGGGDGGGAGGMAALVAALGSRNQSDMGPAMIAAMSGRRDDGMNPLWALIALAFLGRRGGFGGDGGGCDGGVSPGQAALLQTITESLNGLTAAVPTVALETQNAVQSAIASLALGTQQGFANVKDAVQNIGGINLAATNNVNQNVLLTACETQRVVAADGEKTRALIQSINDAALNRIIVTQANEIAELKGDARTHASSLTVTQTVSQNQAQQQQQQQLQGVILALNQLFPVIANLQNAVATNSNLIVGNTGAVATGPQTANPVNVRA